MNNIITIKKKDFLKRFKTGFDIKRNDYGIYNFNPRRTSIEECFLDVTTDELKTCGFVEQKLLNVINPDNYAKSMQQVREKADELYLNKLINGIERLEELLKRFPKYKAFLYAMNIGNENKIEIAKNNLQNLEISKKMVEGKLPLPAKMIHLIPDEFEIPEFIPELEQVYFKGHFDDYMDYGVEQYKVVKISFHDGYNINHYEETMNIENDAVISKIYRKEIKVDICLRSEITGRIMNMDSNQINSLFKSRQDAISYVKKCADDSISKTQSEMQNLV